MKILLDENTPKKLKFRLAEFEVFRVQELGWTSIKNGNLVKLMLENDIRVLITLDRNLQYQQNFEKYPITLIVFKTRKGKYEDIEPLLPKLKTILHEVFEDLKPGIIEIS